MHVWASDSRFACLFKTRCAVQIKPGASHTPLAKKEKLSIKEGHTFVFKSRSVPGSRCKFSHQWEFTARAESFGGLISSLSSGVYTSAKTQNNVWFKIKVCPCLAHKKNVHQWTFLFARAESFGGLFFSLSSGVYTSAKTQKVSFV